LASIVVGIMMGVDGISDLPTELIMDLEVDILIFISFIYVLFKKNK